MSELTELPESAVYVGTRDFPLDELTPYPGNAKRGDVGVIRESLRRNGQYRSLVVRQVENGPLIVLAGNHTMQALAAEGRPTARCEIITCDDAAARRINLADNRTSELGTYDSEALSELLIPLADDLEGTGFAGADLLELLGDRSDPHDVDEDEHPEDRPAPAPPIEPVTQPGDIWILGPHRIICGDVRDYSTVERLLDGARINIAFTSPPYASQRAYDESSGFRPIPPNDYVDWFEDVQANVRAHLADDGSWFVNIKEHAEAGARHLYVKELVIAHVRRWGWRFVDELVWITAGLPGRFDERFKNKFEPVFHFTGASKIKFNPYAVAHHSSGIRKYDPARSFTMTVSGGYTATSQPDKEEGLALPGNVLDIVKDGAGSGGGLGHTAAFPTRLPEWFIKAYSDPRDVVFDPFMGSGTTLIAAHRNNRTAYGAEISTGYCDVICRRFQEQTGVLPVLASTGEAHDFAGGE